MNQQLEGILEQTVAAFHAGRLNCAECVLLTLAQVYGWEPRYIPRIATPFGGGIGGSGQTCGALSGGLMALGILYGREEGGDKAPSYEKAQALCGWMQAGYGSLCCRELTGTDFSDPAQQAAFRAPGGKHEILCEKLVGEVCRFVVEGGA